MAREIPEVVRAAAGLAATVLDEARRLPETLPSLPVRLLGLAMQQAMKLQQQYAGLVARGDELFTGLRGEDEPGLATFDDDDDAASAPVTPPGFRDSAFDRVADTSASDPTTYAVADQLDEAQSSLDDLPDEAPATEEILDELAIDELVEDGPGTAEAAVGSAEITAADTLDAEPTADVATTVDVLTPEGEIASVEATVTDEGVAAPEGGNGAAAATATDESGTPVAAATGAPTDGAGTDTSAGNGSEPSGSQAPVTAPIDGYDSFSIAQLRGRLRGYAHSTVRDLIAYEEATRARAPYLKMLRNRLEKLDEQAVAVSPLAPRGA